MDNRYTHKTLDGLRARVVCTNRKHLTHPVIALVESSDGSEESFVYLTKDLCKTVTDSGYWPQPFLVEYCVWDDVEVDTPVWIKGIVSGKLQAFHFGKYMGGNVFCWRDGGTSHTKSDFVAFNAESAFLQKPE